MKNILTSQSGTGPVMALDITTVPEAVKLRIIHAAIYASIFIGNGEVDAGENKDAEGALDELSAAVNALDQLHQPAVPGADLFTGRLQDAYPVIREGREMLVPREDMTLVEVEATLSRLRMEAAADLRHVDTLAAAMAE